MEFLRRKPARSYEEDMLPSSSWEDDGGTSKRSRRSPFLKWILVSAATLVALLLLWRIFVWPSVEREFHDASIATQLVCFVMNATAEIRDCSLALQRQVLPTEELTCAVEKWVVSYSSVKGAIYGKLLTFKKIERQTAIDIVTKHSEAKVAGGHIRSCWSIGAQRMTFDAPRPYAHAWESGRVLAALAFLAALVTIGLTGAEVLRRVRGSRV